MFSVSIIIPVYNVETYLKRCLDSVIKQTYKTLEIILVDDGSPDKCPTFCDEYATKDERIIVIHKENGGLSDARNAGTKVATGDFIYYLDSDDELPLDAIESMIAMVNEHPNVDIVVGKMQGIPNKEMYDNSRFDDIKFINDNIWVRKNFCRLRNRIPVNACNKLIRKSFFFDNNLFFEKGLIHEDELWMFQTSQVLSKLAFVNKTTYLRYINPGSITTATPSPQKRHAWGLILKKVFHSIKDPAFMEQFLKYYEILKQNQPFLQDSNTKLFNEVWNEFARCAQRHGLFITATLIKFHKLFYPILKGHGTGFVIWLILTKFYGKTYRNMLD